MEYVFQTIIERPLYHQIRCHFMTHILIYDQTPLPGEATDLCTVSYMKVYVLAMFPKFALFAHLDVTICAINCTVIAVRVPDHARGTLARGVYSLCFLFGEIAIYTPGYTPKKRPLLQLFLPLLVA